MKMLNSYQIDKMLTPILDEMHKTGVKIDVLFLQKLSNEVNLKIKTLQEKIYELIGKEFNINSPSQLAEILYKELKIKPSNTRIKKGKTHLSTGVNDLHKIEKLHPAISKILEYREFSKLYNTYLKPLPKLIDDKSRIHTTYAIDTATGRLSSKNPNLQNIPVKTEEGRKIRRAFVAEKGYALLAADYSQIELRIAAHFSEDPTMIKAFKSGKDFHKTTAEELNTSRRTAKIVNFGILYGISSYGLSENLKCSVEEAQNLIDKYFLAYPKLAEYISKTIQKVQTIGYVETMFKRKRMMPELQSDIDNIRKFGERIAINTPFQGTAAEIIKIAMIEIDKELKTKSNAQNTKYSKMILQVHDELIFEVPEKQIESTAQMIKDIMENSTKIKVPIKVDIKFGNNWDEMKEIGSKL